ncbi:DMT family transporter [Pseudorhodobacter sp. E13]|uniref:DMT family transporter n=1 Tax=Pseudorhodobacter sp. E13 TaxID=2487931 RepID=UPI000F8E9333|nr:DMT family transporter [Pseudorhodobacter sp. E13]RUS58639.1 DMT family transporter [Pseudorhodobacter sp. E13]
MELWVIATIAAAAVQTIRFMLQKRLKGLGLSTGGATFSRFLFAVPLACAGVAVLMATRGYALPPLGPVFWGFAAAGGVAQIIATFCTVALFSERSFAVGIAFTKTETVQVALFSAVFLAEAVSGMGIVAILIGLAGVLLLSRPPEGWVAGKIFNRATVLGLMAGALFGASAIGYRGATLEVANADPLFRALLTLACVTAFQTFVMVLWLRWREAGELTRVLAAWRAVLPVGVTGVLGSLGWFTAFALQNAAYVRSVGQVELIFSILVSMLVFGEKPKPREVVGMGLLALSIILIVALA